MKDWLDFIFPKVGFIEARFIRNTLVRQVYYSSRDTLQMDLAEHDFLGWDAYVGILPRVRTGGKAEDVWPTATVLWCDVDAKDFCIIKADSCQGEDCKAAALDAILKFPVTPSAIIDSGHGFHCYWKLRTPADTPDAVEANRAIAHWLGGDKCFDAPRILRVPGTRNHKDPENPIPVRILKLDTLRLYDLSDFTEQIEYLHSSETRRTVPITDRRDDAPEFVRDLANTEPPKGSRSEFEFRVIALMVRLNYSDDEIISALMNMPFGAKAQERGERWAAQEVARIRRKA